MNKKRTPLFSGNIKGGDKLVGYFYPEEKIASFTVTKRHYFQKADAWGIDTDVYDEILHLKCEKIILWIKEQGKGIETDIKTFGKFSWVHQFSGFKPRVFMASDRWVDVKKMSREDEELEILKQATQ